MAENKVYAFKGTKEQEEALNAVIKKYKGEAGGLMPVLQQAQGIYGYLPIEVQIMIADGLEMSLGEVYGVATFYSQFSHVPKGKNNVSVCLGTACYVKGADKILEEIEMQLGIKSGECSEDGKFSITTCRCVGACGLAPVMMVNDDVYGNMTVDKVAGVLKKYMDEK